MPPTVSGLYMFALLHPSQQALLFFLSPLLTRYVNIISFPFFGLLCDQGKVIVQVFLVSNLSCTFHPSFPLSRGTCVCIHSMLYLNVQRCEFKVEGVKQNIRELTVCKQLHSSLLPNECHEWTSVAFTLFQKQL